MDYELKVLEHIFKVILNPLKLRPEKLNDEFLGECLLHAEREKERIKNQFTLLVFEESQVSRIALYYRQHQAILINLADIIFDYLQPVKSDSIYRLTDKDSVIAFYKKILQIPVDLLQFIEHNFADHFDTDAKLPESMRLEAAPEIKRNLKLIRKELLKSETDEKLNLIICEVFENYLMEEKHTSYRKLAYLKVFQQEFTHFFNKNKTENKIDALCRLLLYLNFNNLRFFNYYISRLEEKCKAFESIPEQIEFYALQNKIINQLHLKPGLVFIPSLPSVKELVGNWIGEELYFLEKRGRLLYQDPLTNNQEQSTEAKVQTSLSVAQLALAVKLLMDAKLISNKYTSEILRMVARSFKTDRQEIISEDSLRNKLYNIEGATAERLKDEIVGLLNLVRGIRN